MPLATLVTLRNLRPLTKIIVASLLSLLLAGGAIVFTAASALQTTIHDRAMNRVNASMNVAWYLIGQMGDTVRISDGKLRAGNTILNGNIDFVDTVHRLVGGEITLFQGDDQIVTNVTVPPGYPATAGHLPHEPFYDRFLRDQTSFRGTTEIYGEPYFAAFDPIRDTAGQTIGAVFIGLKLTDVQDRLSVPLDAFLGGSIALLLLVGGVFLLVSWHLAWQVLQRERRLDEANLYLDTALQNMANGLCLWSTQRTLLLANDRFCDQYGLSRSLMRRGLPYREYLAARLKKGHFGGRSLEGVEYERLAPVRRGESLASLDRLPNGRVISVLHQPTPGGGWIGTYEDVTERHDREMQIALMARHDALTRLPNRVLFQERMNEALARGEGVSVFCLDLDHFKEVNDTLGHPIGDTLLQAVAGRLLSCVSTDDTVARLGGDEFAIIRVACTDSTVLAGSASRIIETIAEPFQIDCHSISIGVSVGIGIMHATGQDLETLLMQADLALYRAKSDGRATVRFFEPGMATEVTLRRSLEAELQRAVAQEEFVLFYQPQIDLRTGAVTGLEALVRWAHPTRGMVGPGDFIPLAEATGLIVPLGDWILRRACADAATWPSHLKVAVNLSPVQFKSSNLVHKIRWTLAAAGLAPGRLELELTESALLVNTQATASALRDLMDAGARIALDDFGTGYSSLSYIRRFPISKIKIDRSFVDGIGARREADAIVRSVIGLARQLELETLAEGVETPEQMMWLLAEGCGEMQGHLFSPAIPASQVLRLVNTRLGRDGRLVMDAEPDDFARGRHSIS